MQGFNQRQIDQLEEIVKRVIVQVLKEESRGNESQPLGNVQECTGEHGYSHMEFGPAPTVVTENINLEGNNEPFQVGAPGHYEPKPQKEEIQWTGGNAIDVAEFLGKELIRFETAEYDLDRIIKIHFFSGINHLVSNIGDWIYKEDGWFYLDVIKGCDNHKPTISEHLYNNGRFACCCEVCTCGEPKLKEEQLERIVSVKQCPNCRSLNYSYQNYCAKCEHKL